MIVDSIQNGLVIDHITAGKGMQIYNYLKLNKLDSSVAIITNAKSSKQNKKDIIKIEDEINLNFDILGYIDPNITVNIITNGKLVEKKQMSLPKQITNVVKCKNPRCITSIEPGLPQIFNLVNIEQKSYGCSYCEQEYK